MITSSRTPLSSKELRLLLVLAFIQFVHIVDFMIMMPLGPQLMRIFEISPTQFSWLAASYNFAAAASGLMAALYVDFFDRKRTLLLFYLGFTIGTLSCALANDYHTLLICRSLTGAFGGVLGSLVLSIVGDAISSQNRAYATGIITTSFSLASILGVPLSLFIANHYDWHSPFLMLGLLSLFMIALIQTEVPSMKMHIKKAQPGQLTLSKVFRPVTEILGNPNQMRALAMLMTMVFGGFAVIQFLSVSMVANAGMTESQLPLVYLCGGAFSILTAPLIGKAADRWGRRRIFVIGAIVSSLAFLVITHLGPTPLYLLLPLFAFFFAAMGARMIPAQAITIGTAHPQNRGALMSVLSSVVSFASSAGSAVAGLVVVQGSDGRLLNYGFIGWFAVILTVAAILMGRGIKEVS